MFKNILKFCSIFTVIFSSFLLLFLLSISIPKNISSFIGSYVGLASTVSNSASVKSNEFNTLALQLKNKENYLHHREQSLDKMEYDLVRETSIKYNRFFLSFIILTSVLILLIILNFYRDRKRISHLVEIEHDLQEELEDIEKSYRQKTF